jgi:predicted dehydrogenase
VQLAAVCDPKPNRRALGGAGVRQFERWQDLVADPGLDAVLVASPSDTHADVGVGVLAAGKHLLLEKPIALTLEDADRLSEAERRSGRTAVVGLFLRHHPLFSVLRDLLGRLGRPLFAASAFHNHLARRQTVSGYERRRATGGGVLFDLAYHHFDLCTWLFDSPPVAVQCWLDTRATEDDNAQTILTLASGVRIVSTFSSGTLNENRVEIFGDAGRLVADMYRTSRPRFRPVGERLERRILAEAWEAVGVLGVGANAVSGAKLQPFVTQLEAFGDAVAGRGTPPPRLADGRLALRVVLAAYESARTGHQVAI